MSITRIFGETTWRQAIPRIFADLVLVHVAALTSLAAVAIWQSLTPSGADPLRLYAAFRRFYLESFLPQSALFPMVFLLFGFYHRYRTYTLANKLIVLSKGATVATLLYLFLSFLVDRSDHLSRSVSLAFVLLVNVFTVGARLLKMLMRDAQAGYGAFTKTVEAAVVHDAQDKAPVLVVGGAGYIGSILCRKLLAQGKRVRLFDSFVYGDAAVRELFGQPRFELRIGDCRNIQSVVAAVSGAGSIIDLAAIVGDPACEQDRAAALEINYAATRMLIEIAKGHGVERFLFASSCSVYGETEELCDERSCLRPISFYAQTKVDSEKALLQAKDGRFRPTILRLATVFGASYRPRFDLVVNLLTAKAVREGVITIYNGEQWRPFIHVADVAEGFVKVLKAPLDVVGGQIYNVGDSRLNYTLSQVAAVIQKLVPGTKIEQIENPDRRNYRVSFEKIRRELNFVCSMTLEQGIEDLRQAMVSGQIADYNDPRYHNQRYLKAAGRLASQQEVDAQVMAAFSAALTNQQALVSDTPLEFPVRT
ncbi:MAG: SDR family oxidoreductase [Bryobacteraceae bacterium]|nr:SDR family oxidoreductase [Bryobacteraceae bacterium]MDW8380246.1 SDR family oxidoreductase [Bryobacterales bacterium]